MHPKLLATTILGAAALALAAAYSLGTFDRQNSSNRKERPMTDDTNAGQTALSSGRQRATFGSGCFWCTEAVFAELAGVESVVSGYSGGELPNPTYDDVCSGATGHAEVVQVTFDPAVVSYADLLEAFWYSHDPTTLNRQGGDVGTQYRSVVFYHDDDQRQLAEHYKQQLDASAAYDAPVVTEIAPFDTFYPAEQYHQNFYADNPRYGYCALVIRPKLDKFRQAFRDKLKSP